MWKIEQPLENRNGVLHLGGVNLLKLAEKYGTPLFVTDEARIRQNYRTIRNAFARRWNKFKIFYAVKANNNISILNILRQEGAGADCSCVPELQLASLSKFKMEDILYTGNYNSNDELKEAAQMGVTANLDDISILDRFAKFGLPESICFRINPGFGKGGFEKLVFAGPDAKFGITEEVAKKAYAKAKKLGVKKFGIHMMAGSSVLDADYFGQVTERLFQIGKSIAESVGIEFDFVNIGGGFGVPYKPGDEDLDIERVAQEVTERFKGQFESSSNPPYLYAEPGRYLVCDSTVLLSRVHAVKFTGKKFVGIDAGMNILLRPALYGAYHQMYVVNKLDVQKREKVNVVGQVCENSDILAKDRDLPFIEEGDLIAILNAGAYGYSMSSNYNTRPRAGELLLNNGEEFLIREREDITDILDRQRIPGRLLK
ncbi:MAG: diaminopimelate decarboxylase [Thermoplasmata archaeon]|nr:diaminopimelate decarboxylase [Thermoplasmata archaeon]